MAADTSARAATRLAAFAAAGAITATQELVTAILREIPDADPNLVAEETLSLVSVASARAVAAGTSESLSDTVPTALIDLPFAYHDYLLGGVIISDRESGPDPGGEAGPDLDGGPGSDPDVEAGPDLGGKAGPDLNRSVYDRLGRKREFYSLHLPPGRVPSRRDLRDKMELWMGRISPPGLPEHPAKRLERLSLVSVLHTHVRLLFEFSRNEQALGAN